MIMIDENTPIDADVSETGSGSEAAPDKNNPIDTTTGGQPNADVAPDENAPLDTIIEEQAKTNLTRDKNTPID